ncbi:ketoacyl-ACP synthase III family protein [Streptacidiphilus jiangxiensis]|uniref:3-oxoacyl-[acyl-carrier-protein] synthase-3 n=1 Tax=Streptacidiphilus jiangxiensis TaxID=235985 RepID=A0A1H7I9R8_STRJI|nr:ketoacyl-ACP synthase III family protein [Streptacidiphilus jiangxiensis]SEK59291.1 3-oxoacyl-[acyl-carrier-protein] synthase-3 [Streptacidiphilus jiangxiensis]
MRWDSLYLAGLGACLPDRRETAAEAVAAGRYTADADAANGIRAVRVADPRTEGPAVMAASAARLAVARSGLAAEEFGLVVHAGSGHQGQDLWTPASYVQQHSVGGHAATAEVRQGSVGGLVALELAASWLVARPDTPAALVTAGDSFHLPYVDRWTLDDQQVFGDGAGAVVLSRSGGFARVLSTVTRADSSLEAVYRGTEWTPAPFADGRPVSLAARKRAHFAGDEQRLRGAMATMTDRLRTVVEQALDEAGGLKTADVARVVHANLGLPVARWGLWEPLGLDPERTLHAWGRDLGHMGAADQFVGLDHLVRTEPLAAGDHVLVVGAGTGVVWSAAVLQLLASTPLAPTPPASTTLAPTTLAAEPDH